MSKKQKSIKQTISDLKADALDMRNDKFIVDWISTAAEIVEVAPAEILYGIKELAKISKKRPENEENQKAKNLLERLRRNFVKQRLLVADILMPPPSPLSKTMTLYLNMTDDIAKLHSLLSGQHEGKSFEQFWHFRQRELARHGRKRK